MSTREQVLATVVPRNRLRAAQREEAAYRAFCAEHDLADLHEALPLYLTTLLDAGQVHGRGIRYRLRLLDIAARLEGRPPPSQHPDLRPYLRGLHREAALASPEKGVDPLHSEWVHALGEAILRPTPAQRRDVALLLVAHHTGLSATALRNMSGHDVRLRRGHAQITIGRHQGRTSSELDVVRLLPSKTSAPCPVTALRTWIESRGPSMVGPLFSMTSQAPDLGRTLRPVLRLLRRPGGDPLPMSGQRLRKHFEHLLEPHPRELRDHTILVLAFMAALRTKEAVSLRQRDVQVTKQGLLLRVSGRREVAVALPRTSQPRHCPVRLWTAWQRCLRLRHLTDPDLPAFLQIFGTVVKATPMAEMGLNLLVEQRCREAGLGGDYAFTSLRSGLIRTAARTAVPEHLIARQADLSALHSVEMHVRRETMLSDSIASRVGL